MLIANNTETTFDATKQEEMKESSRTELLCRTWKTVSHENKYMDTGEITSINVKADILFSRAGTYLVNINKSDDDSIDLGTNISNWK